MALFDALLRYKNEGRLKHFVMHGSKKATVSLANGKSFLAYMANEYIIGESDIAEAAANPKAKLIIYNNWDVISTSAMKEAKRLDIEVYTFGFFAHRLDEMNA